MVKFDFSFLFRRKLQNNQDFAESKLSRVLNLFDTTVLGISSTLGSGVYIIAGNVYKN